MEMSSKYLPLYQRLATTENDVANGHEPALDHNQTQDSTSHPPIPSVAIAPWKSSDIPKELPPLPKIANPELERQTFHHPGLSGGLGYTRLEWIGDAFLEMIATVIIFMTFTSMPSGRCSQLREQLVRNTTLAEYFRNYGLMSKAKIPPEVLHGSSGRGRSADKDLIKTQGDMFEAYVAAVILSDPDPKSGLTNCANWLRALWSRTIKDQITKAERDAPAAQTLTVQETSSTTRALTPKEQLASLIVVKGVQIQYKDMPGKKKDKNLNLELFTVGAYLTGWGENEKLLGWGTALSKKEAGQKAAARALESKKQLKVYTSKKEAFLEAQRAADS